MALFSSPSATNLLRVSTGIAYRFSLASDLCSISLGFCFGRAHRSPVKGLFTFCGRLPLCFFAHRTSCVLTVRYIVEVRYWSISFLRSSHQTVLAICCVFSTSFRLLVYLIHRFVRCPCYAFLYFVSGATSSYGAYFAVSLSCFDCFGAP